MNESMKRLVVVSNRLPVAIYRDGAEWKVRPSPGGLVTALAPTMRQTRGLWIGWPGCTDDAPARRLLDEMQNLDYDMEPILLTEDEIDGFYAGLANKTLWPLFHDLLGHFSFDIFDWQAYQSVNRKFAEVIARRVEPDQFIWIHDYHLILVAKYLRELGVRQPLDYFLHIPFPSPDLFRRLPVNREILEALLEYDHLGFQTAQDRRNFMQCIKWFKPEWRRTSFRRRSSISHGDRAIKVGYYPISIDFAEFNDLAATPPAADTAWFLHENMRSDKLMLGLDRLDYTKGIPERFLAFERAIEKYPEMRGHISLVQVVVPSRLDVSEYRTLKAELDSLAGRINGRFTEHGWIPIHYMFRSLDRAQLVGHYKACEIALITPLRDGMNLVAKEYCASQIERKGILILSEFAGAAQQLAKGALMVNPFDIEATADTIFRAYSMAPEERARRMGLLRNEVRRNDVQRWVRWFMEELTPSAHERRENPRDETDPVSFR